MARAFSRSPSANLEPTLGPVRIACRARARTPRRVKERKKGKEIIGGGPDDNNWPSRVEFTSSRGRSCLSFSSRVGENKGEERKKERKKRKVRSLLFGKDSGRSLGGTRKQEGLREVLLLSFPPSIGGGENSPVLPFVSRRERRKSRETSSRKPKFSPIINRKYIIYYHYTISSNLIFELSSLFRPLLSSLNFIFSSPITRESEKKKR